MMEDKQHALAERGDDVARVKQLEPSAPSNARSNAKTAQRGGHEILETAAHCFRENGFAATSIDDVARALGATKGMVYHHFRSKTDLFFAVYRRGMEINEEAVRDYLESDAPPLTRLAQMGMAHARILMSQQSFQRVLTQGVAMHQSGSTTAAQRETLVELIDSRDRYEAFFRRAIEDAAQAEGWPLTNASVATKSFLSVLNSTVFWYTPRTDDPMAERKEQNALAAQLITYALRGLGCCLEKGQPVHMLIEQETIT